ncbi:amidase domain-containing protein [Romboutsia sp.]|uniref:amidase domain-containing protein n=1 Tax=Romboutsia sp. TaxID=1965302 RepID=UPI003F334045
MKKLKAYDRQAAVDYAQKWALSRNPKYMDYEDWGGDCTNFISQCLIAGRIPMDNIGENVLKKWYWYNDKLRTPTWTAAEPFYKYIVGNNNKNSENFGIYARNADYNELEIGDIAQLVYEGRAYHSMIISKVILEGEYLIDYLECQHTYDLLDYPLSLKEGEKRYIKILGYYNY